MSDVASQNRLNVRVYYEDTDASGVVYHANYLKYFERGRTEWLSDAGYDHRQLAESQGLGFTLARLRIDYRRPARLDDRLCVVTSIADHGRARIDFDQRVFCGEHELVTASARVACIELTEFKPQALPADLIQGV
ncbi:tol-pal system-associated acyl-CoA thioesterase [Salinisphaera sp. USBA-960]|uniref:tol-pal system-associated acyl-CoA thioesterase n=1 Tax=Salinisphaera orenii TaxID=856731 RepID=UPI000DBE93F6|nr:tol-pal system-associated acyl-CoA thioesterase [Salifodinibacter halophilus]NNC25988.1 tol-pal system-associated acyl-CoA thioesterase [Salifodinibacter halophilus]